MNDWNINPIVIYGHRDVDSLSKDHEIDLIYRLGEKVFSVWVKI